MFFKILPILIIFNVNIILAQGISIDYGKSYPYGDPYGTTFNRDWDSDFAFSFSLQFSINSWLYLKTYYNYSSFKFDKSLTSEGPGVRDFTVNDHSVSTFAVLLKNELPESLFIYPYIQAGVGYMISNIENVRYLWGDFHDPVNHGTVDGFKFNSISAIFGFGLQMNLSQHVGPYFELNYLFGFPSEEDVGREVVGGFKYIYISFGFKYTINQ